MEERELLRLRLCRAVVFVILVSIAALQVSQTLAAAPGAPNADPATMDFKKGSKHWSFVSPRRSEPPRVKQVSWIRTPIDNFILAKLESEGTQPSPEADRNTLIRRLSLDLLGLPPTPVEVDAFLGDQRPDAYERLIDRLLASPHYGERWGRHWLDLARYADSDGYEKDSPRPYAWLYRNWVIDALNRDLPFDRFTIEQLAGDLLPNPTEAQRIATGFHRNTLTNREGGIDQEEDRVKATVDRVSTTGTVWLGLTIGCAECHSHKYDPISQTEFYGLFAFFNSAMEKELSTPQPAELARYKEAKEHFDVEHAALKARLAAYVASELPAVQREWEKTVTLPESRWVSLKPLSAVSSGGANLKIQPDLSILAGEKSPASDTYTIECETDLEGIRGFRLEILDDSSLRLGPGRAPNGNFVLSEFSVKTIEKGTAQDQSTMLSLQNAAADFSASDWPIAAAIDNDPKTGWAVDPEFNRPHVAVFETKQEVRFAAGMRLIFVLEQTYGKEHTIGRLRISATTSAPPFQPDLLPASVATIQMKSPSDRSESEREEQIEFHRSIDREFIELDTKVAEHAMKEPAFPETKAQTLIENPKPSKAHIHIRGDFLRPGDEVQPHMLSVLPALTSRRDQPDRLDLARWLVDPSNPLTARVGANRIWQHLFGYGLVRTPNDFGNRGELPSHPELLDWLATEFPRLGWSRKSMIRLLLTSATYRQSSHHRADLSERDPNNLLLARQNRFRLEAENVRDVYLAASGRLNPAISGPGIRPPLPADIAALGYANSVKWAPSKGAEQYRRGLYIFFQRTVPYPMLSTFDAPDSNMTCTRRERSNTPLQALTLLNDPVCFDCAQALGRSLAAAKELPAKQRIINGFKRCLSREPTIKELDRLM
ncbi:MAG: DUF1549 and DUF1553 domain-containing protein, partial [Verrucomicrobiota bacterium]